MVNQIVQYLYKLNKINQKEIIKKKEKGVSVFILKKEII